MDTNVAAAQPAAAAPTAPAAAVVAQAVPPQPIAAMPVAAQPVHTSHTSHSTVVVAQTKSVGVAILLTLFFGPLGLFYSSIAGGFIMMIVSVIGMMLSFGLSLFLTWPICVIWGAVAASSHNKNLLAATA